MILSKGQHTVGSKGRVNRGCLRVEVLFHNEGCGGLSLREPDVAVNVMVEAPGAVFLENKIQETAYAVPLT
jgi:hypothetical protein